MGNIGIHVLDKNSDEIVGFFTNNSKETMIISNKHSRSMEDKSEKFDFTTYYKYIKLLDNQDRVIIPSDVHGEYREFVITHKDTADTYLDVQCESALLEDLSTSEPIAPFSLENVTAVEAVRQCLTNVVDYEAGTIDFDGYIDFDSTEYKSPYDLLLQLEEITDMQLDNTIVVEGNNVTKRLIHLRQPKNLSEFEGKELVRTKDIVSIKRKEDTRELVTALKVETVDSKGKPIIVHVYDDKARDRWGRDGLHRWKYYKIEATEKDKMTSAKAIEKGNKVLKNLIDSTVEYEVTAVNFKDLFENEIEYGEKVRVRDVTYEPHFYLEATVKSMTRDIFDDSSKEFTLGSIKEFSESKLRSFFNSMKSELRDKMNDDISNIDTIINSITVEVANNNIHKADTAPTDSPINKLWLDTSTQPAILKRWNGTQWIIDSPTKPEDVGAIAKESAMIISLEQVYKNIANTHLSLQVEVSNLLNNEYLVDTTKKSALNSTLEQVNSIFTTIGTLIANKKALQNPQMSDVVEVQTKIDEYGLVLKDLQVVISDAQKSINDRLKLLQSQYSDEKYNDAMNKVADTIGGTYDSSTGILTANVPSQEQLTTLENKLKTDYQSAINTSASNVKAEIKTTTDSISQKVSSVETSITNVDNKVNNLDIPTQQELDKLKQDAIDSANTNTTNVVNPVALRVQTTESDISTLKNQITFKVESSDVTKIVDDKVNPIQTQVNNQKATLDIQANQIASKVDSSTYTTDKNGIVTRLDNADSARTQLANQISDRVTLTQYNNDVATNTSKLITMQTQINQNGTNINLKASKEEFDKSKETLNKAVSLIDIMSNGVTISSEANGDKSIATFDPNAIKLDAKLIELGNGDITISNGVSKIKNAVINDAHIDTLTLNKLSGGVLNVGGYVPVPVYNSDGTPKTQTVVNDDGVNETIPVTENKVLPNGEINFRNENNEIMFQISSENKGADKFSVNTLTVRDPIKNDFVVSKELVGKTIYVWGWSDAVDDSYIGYDETDGSWGVRTIQDAIDMLPDFITDTYNIKIGANYQDAEHVIVRSKVGAGIILIDMQNVETATRFSIEGCQCRVTILNPNLKTLDNEKDYMIQNYYSHYVTVQSGSLNGNNGLNGTAKMKGVKAYGGGNTHLGSVDIQNVHYAVSSHYLNSVYITGCTGKGTEYGAIAWYGSTININGTCPSGGVANTSNQYSGVVNTASATFPSTTTKTASTTSTVKTQTWYATSSNYYMYSGYNTWATSGSFHYGYPIQGYGYGSPKQVGAWFFGSDMRNTLKGKTIKSIKVKLTRRPNIGNSSNAKVNLVMHKYDSQPSGSPAFSQKSVEIIMDWNETKTVDVTSAFKDYINGSIDPAYSGFGLKPAVQDVYHYAELSKSLAVTVTYI